MSSKDKEISKSKFKSFLKNAKNPPGSNERSLRPEILWELRPEQPVAQRCKILKDLCELHLHLCNLEETAIIKLWDVTKDLLVPTKSAECRQTALTFYKRLIATQYKNLTYMREQFFLVIQNHEVSEDLKHRLELLHTLTENGKDIKNLEEKIGRFMLLWLPSIHQADLLRPYLDMQVNLIKFNAAHLDNDIIIGIVQNACNLSCTVSDEDIGLQCLTILEMVMSYTIFPSDPLPQFVFTLCRTVNIAQYCHPSWKIMKNLLGTELGYHSMKMMCNILNDHTLYEDNFLLRGAVFHLNMNIFGAPMVFQVSPLFYASMVLNSFFRALDSRHVSVTYEVIIGIQIVITKYKSELPEIIWDRICDIMSSIVDNIEYYESFSTTTNGLLQLKNHFHENITYIEKLLEDEKTKLLANYERIYDLIERVAESRPETSVLLLIDYRSSKITATRPEWLLLLNNFVQRFYKVSNTPIRIKVIQSLMNIMDLNRSCYEEEILERVVIPLFTHVCNETDVQLRRGVADALIEFSRHCDTKRCGELLDILEKIINRPFELHKQYGADIKSEKEIQDVITAVDGLIEVFVIKLYRLPSSHAIKIFNILVGHLELNYQYQKVFEQVNVVRYKIFCWMLKARANSSYHIGYPDPTNNDNIKYSYYLGIDSSLPMHDISHYHPRHVIMTQLSSHDVVPNANFTTISIKRACEAIVKCLEKDRDFQIFQLVIKELPKIMQNKALIQGNDVESLATPLFKTISESNKTLHVVYKCTTDELNSLVLPAIGALVIYHQYLQPSSQYKIIEVLKMGISNFGSGIATIANICINTMTTIILEMPEALMRKLPDILLQMSKMSDTPPVALSVLDFLSILSRLSNDLCMNFTSRQYMYVFAISLPYTKPHRYDHYTVSLAHHVIAGWFLKCKLELRRNCVNYIINSIQSNASMLYEDINNLTRNIQRQDFQSLNEDSSNRKRSTSLTERGSRNTAPTAARNHSEMRPLMNEGLKSFHAELAETCIDFLARHTFSPCSALPKRLPAVEYLLKDGHSHTWLVGHNLVTITTSGCPSGPTRNGLCDRCSQLGKAYNLSSKNSTDTNPGTTPISPEVHHSQAAPAYELRYTKVSLQHSSGNESAGSTDLTSSSSTTSHTTQRQTSNSSTASLEALSRRGSNPEAGSTDLGVGSTAGGIGGGSCTSLLGNSLSSVSACASSICVRSCTSWAEILIRRPTGNISWITRIQNPISNDCFGYDVHLSSMVSLFLPTSHGGVFGPDFLSPDNLGDIPILNKGIKENIPNEPLKAEPSIANPCEENPKSVSKTRALQRQEEISSSAQGVTSTQAIDIPTMTASGKRGKEALSGSVSDGEADEEYLSIEDGQMRARKPVRRVNSSPEMSSSWRDTFLMNKPAPLSKEPAVAVETTSEMELQQQHQPQSQQKKKCVQYSKVSCEAIPEEIAGSTPPQQASKTASQLKAPEDHILPPKQLSADDVSQKSTAALVPVQQSASETSLKSAGTGAAGDEKIMAKPPLSPAPIHSPRQEKTHAPATKSTSFGYHQGLAKSSSGGNNSNMASSKGGANPNGDYNNGEMRGRSKTISVVREVNNGKTRPPTTTFPRYGAPKPQLNAKLCMNPSFIFMQLYHTGQIQATDVPIKVPPEQMSAVNLLDLAPPFETHKIGVLYVGQGQCNNVVEILRNSHGSTRYVEFLRSIGTLVSLKEAAQNNLFVTLDTDGADGKFTYIWKDDIVQVTFHVATLMPTKLNSDPNCNEKKKHIGNDYVNIIYNESGEEYNLNTISGQFNYACVIVEPMELNTNRVYVKARPEIAQFVCHPGSKIVSDKSAPLLARQMALHANLASNVYQSLQKKSPYASNWLERLRSIKRLRTKLLENQNRAGSTAANADVDDRSSDKQNTNRDFSKYT